MKNEKNLFDPSLLGGSEPSDSMYEDEEMNETVEETEDFDFSAPLNPDVEYDGDDGGEEEPDEEAVRRYQEKLAKHTRMFQERMGYGNNGGFHQNAGNQNTGNLDFSQENNFNGQNFNGQNFNGQNFNGPGPGNYNPPPEKPPHKWRRRLIKLAILVFILFVFCRYGTKPINWLFGFGERKALKEAGFYPVAQVGEKQKTSDKSLAELGVVMESEEDREEMIKLQLEEEPSDIKGMTKWEKYQQGLSTEDGSDSDNDGLTDKEEIEVYHSDPLKKSTAGDLYTDGYKAAHNMTVTQAYNYEGDYALPYNQCDEIELTVKDVNDFDGYSKKVKSNFALSDEDFKEIFEGYTVYAVYTVGSTCTAPKIDVSGIVQEYGLDKNDLVLIIGDVFGNNMREVDYEYEGNVMVVDDEDVSFDHYSDYGIAIATEQGFFAGLNPFNDNSGVSNVSPISGDGFYFYSRISSFFKWQPNIYYVETGNEAADLKAKKKLVRAANYIAETKALVAKEKRATSDRAEIVTVDDVHCVSQMQYDTIYNVVSLLAPTKCKVNPFLKWPQEYNSVTVSGDIEEVEMWFSYCSLDMLEEYMPVKGAETQDGRKKLEEQAKEETEKKTVEEEEEYVVSGKTPFSPFTDTFAFPNMGTPRTFGLCFGYSYLAARLYVEGTIPAKGSTTVFQDYVTYDLSGKKNKSVLDPGLVDVRNADFRDKITEMKADENYICTKDNLDKADQQLINCLECYWWDANANTPSIAASPDNPYSWDMIELAKNKIDKNGVVIVNFNTTAGGGHSVLAYKYDYGESTEVRDDYIRFYIYDCNYPMNVFVDGEGREYEMQLYMDFYRAGNETLKYQYRPILKYENQSYTIDYGFYYDPLATEEEKDEWQKKNSLKNPSNRLNFHTYNLGTICIRRSDLE